MHWLKMRVAEILCGLLGHAEREGVPQVDKDGAHYEAWCARCGEDRSYSIPWAPYA